MELSLKKIALEDRERLEPYLRKKSYRSCELIFANIFLWSGFYPVQYALIEDTLVFFSRVESPGVSFSFPAGEEEKVKAALEVLFSYFQERGWPIRMHLVQEQEFALLEQWYPGRFSVAYDRDAADYIYEAKDLLTLAGKRFHGKRNHISNFKKNYPDWSYEAITEENLEECRQMALEWKKEHICQHDEEKAAELCVTLNALRYFKELELKGGLLRAEGKIVAFTIGEPLSDDTFVVHIEKAFSRYQGAYPMINQQFLLQEATGFRYVNREEDTGSQGLRKAKLSYHPVFLINKGMVTEKETL